MYLLYLYTVRKYEWGGGEVEGKIILTQNLKHELNYKDLKWEKLHKKYRRQRLVITVFVLKNLLLLIDWKIQLFTLINKNQKTFIEAYIQIILFKLLDYMQGAPHKTGHLIQWTLKHTPTDSPTPQRTLSLPLSKTSSPAWTGTW